MDAEEVLGGILIFIIIEVWLFHSDKLGHQLKKIIVIVVDVLAFLMFCVTKVELYKKVLLIFLLLMGSFFWILRENHEKKEITLQDIKESHLNDMCFCTGIVIIILFFVRMLFGLESF